ncbi:ASCH domain-containing protein [Desulfovibrio sp. 3_1_syn3]|uniref:ASCH domain-containing protein n=1 Tax=Desulfovibrio sp. 3_1_syn3 TaxID=457398 RepID=UPI0011CA2635|nr:ASCH domain-containing protein [Desulfovibrio sp. 3_1_syn3]
MKDSRDHILISVKPQFSRLIENGVKTVELRKKIPDNLSGKRVYIYSTCPEAKVIGFFEANNVENLPLNQLWEKVKSISGMNQEDFFSYYEGKSDGYAIFFQKFVKLKRPVSLEALRKRNPNFVPPQSFRYIVPSKLLGKD